jgi:foldase protein PrsA
MKSNTRIVIVAVFLVLALVVGGTIIYQVYESSNSYVATIAGEKVTTAEFKFFLRMIKNDYETKAGVDYQSDDVKKNFWKTTTNNGELAEVTAKNDALKEVQKFKIMLMKAKQANITLDNTELEKAKQTLDNIVLAEGDGDKAKAEKNVKKKYWITLAEYDAIYKNYMLAFGKYASVEADNIKITDSQLQKKYIEAMDKEGKVTVWEVFLETVDPSGKPLADDKVKEKTNLAKEVFSKAKKGEKFDTLVSTYTDDTGAKQNGGEFSVTRDEKMPKEYIEWVFNAKEGDIGLVTTDRGYYIIKRPEFGELKDSLKRTYQLDEVNKKLDAWMKDEQYKMSVNKGALNSIKLY